ncbi:hypothetical protein BJ742DRAFT_839425 [Cladochytrium replicatum]|nr:hypothetical protein BJ742DRAFT_839425 [Cladochytrium replicatum]
MPGWRVRAFLDRFTGRSERTSKSRTWTIITLTAAIFQAVVVLPIEAYIMSRLNVFLRAGFANSGDIGAATLPFIFVYQSLFMLAQLFQIALVADAAWVKNTLQIISVAVFNSLCFAFSIVQVFQIESLKYCVKQIVNPKQVRPGIVAATKGCPDYDSTSPVIDQLRSNLSIVSSLFPFEMVVCAISFVFFVASWYIALRTYRNWGWQIYSRTTGADLVKRSILRRYHLFVMLLKYNVYFCAGLIVQFVIMVYYNNVLPSTFDDGDTTNDGGQNPDEANALNDGNTQIALIIVSAVALVYFILGWLAVRRGNWFLMLVFQLVILCNLGAVFFMIYKAYFDEKMQSIMELFRFFFTLFAVVSAIINVALFVIGLYCIKGFSHPGYRALVTPPPIHISRNHQQHQPDMVEVSSTQKYGTQSQKYGAQSGNPVLELS